MAPIRVDPRRPGWRVWAERGEVEGAQQIGTTWAATPEAWAAVAAKQRGRGRPRKTKPLQES